MRLGNGIVKLLTPRLPSDSAGIVRQTRKYWGLKPTVSSVFTRGLDVGSVESPVRGEWLKAGRETPVVLYFHGGGYISCSPGTHRSITATLARGTGGRVFSLDYRLAPEHPFPAAIEDAVVAYQWLLEQGAEARAIVLAGDSAGGGLVLAALLRSRELGLPLPAGGLCFSPWTDLLGSGQSILGNAATDPVLQPELVSRVARLYLGDADPRAPLASPIYADLRGLPPMSFHVSESEILFDDARAIDQACRQAGVTSELKSWAGVPHCWQLFGRLIPESRQSFDGAIEFVRRVAST